MKLKMSEPQVSAFEVYVGDPIHIEPGAEICYHEDSLASCTDYRAVAAMRHGDRLVVPPGRREAAWRVLTDAANSADAEETAEGNRAARSLTALSMKVVK